MTSPPRAYPQEFIDNAVHMVIEGWQGVGPARRSMQSVSSEPGVPLTNLHPWVHKTYPDLAPRPARGPARASADAVEAARSDDRASRNRRASTRGDEPTATDQDLARIRRENAILKATLAALLALDLQLPAAD